MSENTQAASQPSNPEGQTQESRFIPLDRFNEVVGQRNELREEIPQLKQKADLLDKLLANQEFNTWMENRGKGEQTPAPDLLDADPRKLDAMIEQKVRGTVDPMVRGFTNQFGQLLSQVEMQNLKSTHGLSDKQMKEAEPYIREKQSQNPSLTADEAYRLAYFDNFAKGSPKIAQITGTQMQTSTSAPVSSSTAQPSVNIEELKAKAQEAIAMYGPHDTRAEAAQLAVFQAFDILKKR